MTTEFLDNRNLHLQNRIAMALPTKNSVFPTIFLSATPPPQPVTPEEKRKFSCYFRLADSESFDNAMLHTNYRCGFCHSNWKLPVTHFCEIPGHLVACKFYAGALFCILIFIHFMAPIGCLFFQEALNVHLANVHFDF